MKFVAVLRANGERTEDVAHTLLSEQAEAAGGNVHVLHISPFFAAVQECFRIGLESGADWLMVADADVLTSPGVVARLLELAAGMPTDVMHFQGLIHDKLWMGERRGGHRMWRVAHLESAQAGIRDSVRVEADMIRRITGPGLRSVKVNFVTGRHDYEQRYADLYRKAAAHSRKHAKWEDAVVPKWKRSADADLRCAYAGWRGARWEADEKPPLPAQWRPAWG